MYTEDFEQFWKWCKWPVKGSKKKAYEQFRKHAKDMPPLYQLETILQDQIEYKEYMIEHGHWQPSFPHVERWIKHFRWEDDIDEQKDNRGSSDPFSRALAQKDNREINR